MCGWFSDARTCASRWNRASRSASSATASGSTLIATSRLSLPSRARYTSPIPPAPRGDEDLVGAEACSRRESHFSSEVRHPVGHDADQRGRFDVDRDGQQKPLSVRRGVERSARQGLAPEKRPRGSDEQRFSTGFYVHGEELVVGRLEKKDLPVVEPAGGGGARGGNLPLFAEAGERDDVDFAAAGLVGGVGEPLPVRGDRAVGLLGLGGDQGMSLALSLQGQRARDRGLRSSGPEPGRRSAFRRATTPGATCSFSRARALSARSCRRPP